MRHVVAFVLIVIGCVCVPARPAEAQGVFLEWLERLSGPGPFKMKTVHVTFGCYGYKKDRPTSEDPVVTTDVIGAQRWFFQVGCGSAARNLVRLNIGLQAAWGSGDNNLLYDDSVPEDDRDRVGAKLFVGTLDVGLHNSLEVGVGTGFAQFSDLPVGSFTRVAVQPGRLIWKPLAMFASKGASLYQREALQVRITATWFPGGFTDEDFGALPGTFDTGKEIQTSLMIGLDVFALLKVNPPTK
jgi:hypothetical protein